MQKMLVGVDGSEAAGVALELAVEEAGEVAFITIRWDKNTVSRQVA